MTTEAFSTKVPEYVASRPDYPAALFDEMRALGVLSAHSRIADIGAGTGIFSRGLLVRGYEVIAVEPNAAMRSEAEANLHAHSHYRSVAGSAEATTLDDASIDLITTAQAFLWFDVDGARAEFLRILKPNGNVALVWNDRVLTDPLQAAMDEVFTRFGGAKRNALLAHEDRTNVTRFFAGAPFHTLHIPHEQQLDQEGLVSLALSRSYMPSRDSEAGKEVRGEVINLFKSHASGDVALVRYETVAMIGRPARQLES
jgi:SAM-dependent methyltransferase